MSAERIRPYEQLSDPELNQLVDAAVDLRLRLAMLSPGEVRQTMIEHGCPREAADMQTRDPRFRIYAAKFHLDVEDAALGDRAARERVDHVTESWAALRRNQEATTVAAADHG
jgi:hypothetical protein